MLILFNLVYRFKVILVKILKFKFYLENGKLVLKFRWEDKDFKELNNVKRKINFYIFYYLILNYILNYKGFKFYIKL